MSVLPATVRQYSFFGLEFEFNNVAFTAFGFEVYWYGILIAVGFLLALLYAWKNAARFGIDRDKMMDVVIAGMIGAIVCARAYYLLFDGVPLSSFDSFGDKVRYIVGIHNGGIAIYGGIIGAFLAGGLTAKLRKVKVLDMFDIAALGFLIGQSVGRWGNFVNQEVYGQPTGSDWFGVGGTRIGSELVHPLFLYESLWCLAAFIILHNISKKRRFSGQIFLGYVMFYSFGRYWLEGMRNTEFILMFGKMSISQLVSIAAFVASLVLYIVFYRRTREVKKEYTDVFGDMCDDENILAAAYSLIGCTDDSTDEEVEQAYAALRDKYTAMLPEQESADEGADSDGEMSAAQKRRKLREDKKAAKERAERDQAILASDAPDADDDGMVEISDEELAVRVRARLSEIEKAYKYICGNRELAAAERSRFEQSNDGKSDGEDVGAADADNGFDGTDIDANNGVADAVDSSDGDNIGAADISDDGKEENNAD